MERRYVLITAAKNEEAYIESTIRSVISQTLLPKRWVIVSDGSTDHTDEIVRKYAVDHRFIDLLKVEGDEKRSVSSKVSAFSAGFNELEHLGFDFVGNLDADVTFGRSYYERLLHEFDRNPYLGVAGGIVVEIVKGKCCESRSGSYHVAGAFQLFRRRCYDQIGGYIALKTGGEDSFALIRARMKGWETRMLPELKVFHHRPEGDAFGGAINARFRQGITDYNLGANLIFSLGKFVWRLTERPCLVGSLARLAGFLSCCICRDQREASPEIAEFYCEEQMRRLRALFKNAHSLRLIR